MYAMCAYLFCLVLNILAYMKYVSEPQTIPDSGLKNLNAEF